MNSSYRARTGRAAAKVKVNQAEVVRLLSQRFGDGLVYMAEDADQEILRQAIDAGLVSADGQLTTAGYRALKRSLRD